jgi:hypothetical protein
MKVEKFQPLVVCTTHGDEHAMLHVTILSSAVLLSYVDGVKSLSVFCALLVTSQTNCILLHMTGGICLHM